MAQQKPVSIPKNPAWLTQYLVQKALIGRQIKSRFGHYQLGFLWMIVEPLTSVLVIGLVIGTFAQRTIPEIPYVFFLLNGMMLMQLFNSCINSGMNAIGASNSVLVYPAVKPMDPFLARFLFQLLITLFSSGVFCIAAYLMGIEFSLNHLEKFIACYLLTWIGGMGLGFIIGVAVAYFPEFEMVVGFLQRPLIFISAVLFPSAAMADSARSILMWNPLVHTIEQARQALFPFYNAAETNLTYPSVASLCLLALGLSMFRNNEQFLTQR